MKIVVLDGYVLNPGDISWDELQKLGDLKVYDRTTYNAEEFEKIVERAKDSEIILTNKTPITRQVIRSIPGLKYIGVLATGYNVVDVKAAKEANVVVTNIPAYGTGAVAQMTFALILEMCNHVGAHGEAVKRGDWTNNIEWCFWNHPIIELAGKNIGIIGFGRIGQAVARMAQIFGMKILVHSRHKIDGFESSNLEYVELEKLFELSDIISLHCPLTDDTRGIINKQSIIKMKDRVMIVNTSRGPLIVEEDLAEALESGKVSAAAVDVVSSEPIRYTNPLLKAKNCIITPHIAWASIEARQRLMDIAVNNVKCFMEGKPVNVVE